MANRVYFKLECKQDLETKRSHIAALLYDGFFNRRVMFNASVYMERSMETLFRSGIGFVRDSVVYRDFAYRIDRSKTKFWAHVENESCWWMIEIHCLAQDYDYPLDEDDVSRWPPDDEPTVELSLPHELLPKTWRELSDSTCSFVFGPEDAFPICPGMLSTAYTGTHYSCTDHHLAFGKMFQSSIPLRWKTIGKKFPEDTGEPFFVDVELRFAGIRCFTTSESHAEILKAVSPWFEQSDFQVGTRDDRSVWLTLVSE